MAYQPKETSELLIDIEKLQETAVKSGHLDESENLIELIDSDLSAFKETGLSRDCFLKLFQLLKASSSTVKSNITKKVLYPNFIQEHFQKYDTTGWCMWMSNPYIVELHDKIFDVYNFVWGGAEQCPILKFYDPEKYYGYSWGSNDWFFRNRETDEWFYVPDLFPLQFANYGFAQGKKSAYRTDPVELANFLGLKADANYEKNTVIEDYWNTGSMFTYIPDHIDEGEEVLVDGNVHVLKVNENRYVAYNESGEGIDIEFEGLPIKATGYNYITMNKSKREKYTGHNLDKYSISSNEDAYDKKSPEAECSIM